MDGDVEHAEDVVDAPAGQHQTRIHCTANNPVMLSFSHQSGVKNRLYGFKEQKATDFQTFDAFYNFEGEDDDQ